MKIEEQKPNNPSAFPVTATKQSYHNQSPLMPESGMTLRDYFAAKAMQGCLNSSVNFPNTKQDIESLSEIAYLMADAMLKQRES